ncbi:SusC/RagA family TonB-linked outer membrane protein [Hymenobacter gummosus]|uniref:SusC/RagA family TonB-linked outer membrane protein n=1 Tax=Hymenobacter gummosus TaxID=1776032 RepID=UPI0014050A19|nr:TonB-dependent receptor [Hymenobacter gummosus]
MLLSSATTASYAQSRQTHSISGLVISADSKETIAGATVILKGTTTGNTTNADGKFILNVPAGEPATLVVSFLGYRPEEVTVEPGQNVVEVRLEENVATLNDVVVIGFGAVKKRDVTGSIASVKAEEIVQTPTHNAVEALQGRVPGADIVRNSGAAGAGSSITIRGNRSINSPGSGIDKNSPLVVIDGYQGGNISDLNPNDIESVEVLKDASATAIYGAQGANGVIIVSTKRGAAGKVRVDYNGYYGVNDYQFPESRIGEGYVALRREAFRTVGQWSTPADDARLFPAPGEYDAVQNGQWVNWMDLVKNRGIQQSHAVSLRGGSEATKVFASAGYFREEGMLTNNFNRLNSRLNLDQTISKVFKTGLLTQVTYYQQNDRRDPLSVVTSISPLGVPYDADGRVNTFPIASDQTRISPLADELGPNTARNNTIRTNIIANGYLEAKPLRGLTLRTNFGSNMDFRRQGIFNDRLSLGQNGRGFSAASTENTFSRFINWDNIVTYVQELGKSTLTLTGITNYIRSDVDNTYAGGQSQLLSSQLFYDLNSTSTTARTFASPSTPPYVGSKNMAYAGRVNYNYAGKYLLTVTGRYDGASRLAPGNKWDFFPSVAAAWNIGDEDFLRNSRKLTQLKLRTSYGVAGNYAIAPYGTQSVLSASPRMSFGDVPAQMYTFSPTVGNPNLGWEKSATLNLGLDLGFFDNRLTANLDVYDTRTSDILLLRPLPLSTGVTQVYENIGGTRNRGVELAVTSQNFSTENFSWTTTLTLTRNKEEITDLLDGRDIIATSGPETNSLLLGRPVGSFYTYEKQGIWQTSEADEAAKYKVGNYVMQPGDIKVADLNGDFIIDAKDQTYIGSTVPKFVAGLQNTVRYRGFDLNVFALARYGQMINAQFLGRYNPSGNGNGPASLDYWTPENPTNDFPRPRKDSNLNSYAGYTGYQALNFVDGSFFKIRTMTLGYTLPKSIGSKVMLQNARLYVTATNLLILTKSDLLDNYDPERGGAESTPLSRQVLVGLNLSF